MDEVIYTTATNFKQERSQIVSKMVGLAGVISSIIDYPTKTLLLEVSKIARDQMLNENIKPDYGAFRVQLFKIFFRKSRIFKNQEVSNDSEAQPTAPTTSAVKWKEVMLALKAFLAVFAKFSSPKLCLESQKFVRSIMRCCYRAIQNFKDWPCPVYRHTKIISYFLMSPG
uniref:Uncharacterized protein n=1 Tax=Ditylenchus dipsaci TaxID=166011 RepID=A0A915DH00_9BILA